MKSMVLFEVNKLRRLISIITCSLILFLVPFVGAQEVQDIMTAEQYLTLVGERYGPIKDYEARVTLTVGETEMYGTIMHRSPNLMRLDFTKPEEQVISFNGEVLTVYLPEYRAALTQSIQSNRSASSASMASAQGLTMLRRNYVPAYAVGPDPIPIEDESEELVVRLLLTRRSISEGFREILLDINPETKLIRRLEGRTIANEIIRFDFYDIRLDQGLPEARFIYDSPPSANRYNNFLFRDTE